MTSNINSRRDADDDVPYDNSQSQAESEFQGLVRNETVKSLRLYRRISVSFAIFVVLLLAAVIVISIVLASRDTTCDDFSPEQRAIIDQVIHPSSPPNTWKSTAGSVLPPPRFAHAACGVADKFVYLFGGAYGSVPLSVPYVTRGDMWRYEEATDTWTSVVTQDGTTPSPRLHTTLVAVNDNALLLFGGFNAFPSVGQFSYNDINVFFVDNASWYPVTPATNVAPSPRGAHAAAFLNSAMYIYGGFAVIGTSGHLKELWKFSWTTKTWTNLTTSATSPEGRIGCSLVDITNNLLILTAGACAFTDNPLGECNSTWSYVPSTNSWTQLAVANVPPARRASGSDTAVGGILFTFGGFENTTSGPTLLNDLYAIDTTGTPSWMPMYPNFFRPPQPPKSFGHSMTRISNKLIVFGGRTGSPASPGSSQTWEYTTVVVVN